MVLTDFLARESRYSRKIGKDCLDDSLGNGHDRLCLNVVANDVHALLTCRNCNRVHRRRIFEIRMRGGAVNVILFLTFLMVRRQLKCRDKRDSGHRLEIEMRAR